jgi:NADH-quinone oxidoreductase subunit H
MPTDFASLVAPLLVPLVKIAILCGGLMTAAAYLVLVERWMAAWIQDRRGPNRVGIPLTNVRLMGLGQPLADGLKFIFKEEYTPGHVDKALFILAPISILAAALALFAVVPLGAPLPPIDVPGLDGPVPLVVAPQFDVGMIYVFALSSIAVYGVILGGWASNNKYSFLGGLRSSAQLIAYEIPLGLGLLGVVMASGTLRLDAIIAQQAAGTWNAFTQPLGLTVFFVAAFAEAARLPFDLPEAEQELVGGYHTEYSGLKLLLFLVAEFLHMITAAFLVVILFFGGWHFWGMPTELDLGSSWTAWAWALARVAVLLTKVLLVVLFFMLVRWSWPRFRFDQLMALAWKVMLPLGLVNLLALAVLGEYAPRLAERWGVSPSLLLAAGGWGVLVLAWVAAALWAPLHSENRPQAVRRSEPEGNVL